MKDLFDKVFYDKESKRYSIIEKKVFEFLSPKRGDVLLEIWLFNKFKEEILDKYNLKFNEIYFAIELKNSLYIVLLTSKYMEYYVSKGDELEAQKVVTEFIGYLTGYLQGFEIGFKEGLENAKI